MRESDSVKYCLFCKCETWHCGEMCEWSDLHPVIKEEYKSSIYDVTFTMDWIKDNEKS